MAHGCCWPRGGCQGGGGSRGQGARRGLHSPVILKGILEPEELSSAEPGPAKPGNKSTGGCRVVINICWMVMEGGLGTRGEVAGWGPWEGSRIWQVDEWVPSQHPSDGWGVQDLCQHSWGLSWGRGDASHTNIPKTKHWGSAGVSWMSPWCLPGGQGGCRGDTHGIVPGQQEAQGHLGCQASWGFATSLLQRK